MKLFNLEIRKRRTTCGAIDRLNKAAEDYFKAFDAEPRAFVVGLETRADYVTEMVQERRYINTMRYDNGMNVFEFDGKPLILVRGVPYGVVFALPQLPWEFAPNLFNLKGEK